MTIQVRIPCSLRKFADGQSELAVRSGDMAQFLAHLEEHHAPLYDSILLPGGQIQPFVKIFVNDTEFKAGAPCPGELRSGDVVSIVTAIAGG